MTIREMEEQCGMTRANIRYYEQQGLLSPQRTANGYRDYSAQDLQTLLRIKLLRWVGLSLEDIKALQKGEMQLPAALEQRLQELAQVCRDAEQAQEVCRILQREAVSYSSLNAQRYLESIEQGDTEPLASPAADAQQQVFFPWRRYFARMLDLSLYMLLWQLLLRFGFHINIAARGGLLELLDTGAALLQMLFLEPLLLCRFGTTPGKWIFGLRLESVYGRRPGYADGLVRTWGVLVKGLGLGIPIVSLIALWGNYHGCKEGQPRPWDDELDYMIQDTKAYRGAVYAGAELLVVGILVLATIAAPLPPNRGSLTVAEFAENYNAMASFFQAEGAGRLDQNGRWITQEQGIGIIKVFDTWLPPLEYTLEAGVITGVGFTYELVDGDQWFEPLQKVSLMAALAYVGAQPQVGFFSHPYDEIAQVFRQKAYDRFSLTLAGVEMVYDTQHTGYILIPANDNLFLLPDNDADSTYFKMHFRLNKSSSVRQ